MTDGTRAHSGLAVARNTQEDVVEGDARYMSIELLHDDVKDLTKCDIFSLGCTLYEMVRLRTLPVAGDEWRDLRNGKLGTMATVPHLQQIVRAAMMADPALRPSAKTLLDETPALHSKVEQRLEQREKEVKQLKEGASARQLVLRAVSLLGSPSLSC